MYKKKIIAGYTLIGSGSMVLVCVVLFILFGYNLTPAPALAPEVEFEEDQTRGERTAQDNISIPGFESWTIDEGRTAVSTNFYNPENNTCYFIISVELDETGEKIYESKYLKPGQHLYEVELQKALKAGTYQATIHYSAFSMEDLTPLNGAQIPFKLVVNPV